MTEKNLYFYTLDEKGSAEPVTQEQWQSTSSLTWVHGNLDTMKDILQPISHLPPLLIDAVLSKETQPRVIIHNDTLIMTCRFVDNPKNKTSKKMRSLRIIITKSSIITIQKQPIQAINNLKTLFHEGMGPTSSSSFITTLLSLMTEQCTSTIYSLEDHINNLEDRLSSPSGLQFEEELKNIRQKVIFITRYLKPQRDAILKLIHTDLSWMSQASLARLSESYEAHNRMIEDLSSIQARSEVIHEQQISIGQQKANRGLYWLTIVATIFMPLNLLAGLLGMNVTGIPGSQHKHGFLWVCMIMLTLTMLLIIYFKKQKRL
jgi:zinc transporter